MHECTHGRREGEREGERGGQRQFEGRGEPTDRRTDRPSFFFLSVEGGREEGEHLLKRDIDIPPFPSSLISAAIFHLSLSLSFWPPPSQKPEEGLSRHNLKRRTSRDPPLLLVTEHARHASHSGGSLLNRSATFNAIA